MLKISVKVTKKADDERVINMLTEAFSSLSNASKIFNAIESENIGGEYIVNPIKQMHSILYDNVIVDLGEFLEKLDPYKE